MEERVPRLEFQQGWVDLTLEGSRGRTEAVGLAKELLSRFNPLERTLDDQDLLNDLADRAVFLNRNAPLLAAAHYTPDGVALVDLWVDSYAEEEAPRPEPGDVVPLLLDWSNAKVAGDPDIRYLDLEAGPAVRVQAVLKEKRILGFGSQLAELVRYAVFPPGANYLVVVTATWQDMARTDDLVRLTDQLVASMSLVPVEQGEQIDPAD
ncbi:hypothetical protein [Streptomyces sp. NPDC058739]|uniref:hypothetical protein n=1 Tax=Streptomyces sp. NPDC058739 TaxID=3346618 RepID=UPI003673910B